MRFNAVAQHMWDVRVALDPAAAIGDVTAELLAEHFVGTLGCMLGLIAEADVVSEPAVVAVDGSGFTIRDSVALTSDEAAATAAFGVAMSSRPASRRSIRATILHRLLIGASDCRRHFLRHRLGRHHRLRRVGPGHRSGCSWCRPRAAPH